MHPSCDARVKIAAGQGKAPGGSRYVHDFPLRARIRYPGGQRTTVGGGSRRGQSRSFTDFASHVDKVFTAW